MPSFRSLREKYLPGKKKKKKDEFKGLDENKELQKYNMKLAKEEKKATKEAAEKGELEAKVSPDIETTKREKIVGESVEGVKKALKAKDLTHEESMEKSPAYRYRMKLKEERKKEEAERKKKKEEKRKKRENRKEQEV